jgi:hypothetical protein
VKIGAKALWLQAGIVNDDAASRAAQAGYRRDGRVYRRDPLVVAGASEACSALISRSSLVTSVSS